MPKPAEALRDYAVEVASWLRGEGPDTHLPQQPSPYPVPIYLAALTSQNVELAGEDRRWRHAAMVVGGAPRPQQTLGRAEAGPNPAVVASWK